MKIRILSLILILIMSITSAFSQEKVAKPTKAEKKAKEEKQIEELINSKEFVFVGRFAIPMGYRQVNLASNPNYLKFQPEMIDSQMPFFGNATSPTGYGTDSGVKFKAKPEKYEIRKSKKGWEVEAVVTDQNDSYKIFMTVGASGNSNLTITSTRRSSISYSGDINPVENK